MNATIHINASIVWGVKRTAEGNLMGVCDPLGLTLQAKDDEELRSLIEETQHFLFLDLLEDGELENFLRARGWTADSIPQRMPEFGVRFEAPFKLDRAHAA